MAAIDPLMLACGNCRLPLCSFTAAFQANRPQRLCEISRVLADVHFAVVCGAETGDVGQHVLATVGKRHDVVDLRIPCSVRAFKDGMSTAGNFALMIGP